MKKRYCYEFYFDGDYLAAYPKKWYTLDEAIEDFIKENKAEFDNKNNDIYKVFLETGEGYVRYGFYRNEDTGERERGYYITVEKKKTYQDCWCVCFMDEMKAVGFLEESEKWRDDNK